MAINYASREQPALDLAAKLKKEYNVKTAVVKGVRFSPKPKLT